MSKGRRIIPIRFDEALIQAINRQIASRNRVSYEQPWCFSDFVRSACREKLAKMSRSRGGRGNPKPLKGGTDVEQV